MTTGGSDHLGTKTRTRLVLVEGVAESVVVPVQAELARRVEVPGAGGGGGVRVGDGVLAGPLLLGLLVPLLRGGLLLLVPLGLGLSPLGLLLLGLRLLVPLLGRLLVPLLSGLLVPLLLGGGGCLVLRLRGVLGLGGDGLGLGRSDGSNGQVVASGHESSLACELTIIALEGGDLNGAHA
jgi:hypothetical protein